MPYAKRVQIKNLVFVALGWAWETCYHFAKFCRHSERGEESMVGWKIRLAQSDIYNFNNTIGIV